MNLLKILILILMLSAAIVHAGQIENTGANWQLRVERDPFDLVAIFNYAQILEQQNKNDEALAQIQKVEMLRPREDFYLPVKANLLEKKNRHAEALIIWKRLAQEHNGDLEAYRRLYHSSIYNNEWQQAYDAANTLIKQFDDSPELWHERMALLAMRHLNRPLDSAEHWWQIWLRNKNDLALFRSLSSLKALPQTQPYSEKIKQIHQHHMLVKNNPPDGLKLIMAIDQRQSNNHGNAIKTLLEIKTKDLISMRDQELALAYWEIEHYDMAGAVLEKLYLKTPNPVIACQLGKLYSKLAERAKLLTIMKKLDHQLADFTCWDMKARALALSGDSGMAIEIYQDWLKQINDDSRAHWGKAMVHLMRSEWNMAIEHLAGLEKYPVLTNKINLLGQLNKFRKNKVETIRMPASIPKQGKTKP